MSSTTPQRNTETKADHSSKDVAWYHRGFPELSPAGRELFENYSHIPTDKIESHVLEIRERAWAVKQYPCIGMFGFLNLSIFLQPCYARILSFLKEPQSQHTFLDLGCCFAQDLRKLVHDGVPSENLYGCDLVQDFLDLSYDLFRDKETLEAHLFAANIFDEHGPLEKIDGKIDVVYLGSFLHVFSWDDQLKICKRVIKILKAKKGSTAFGRQTGNLKAREVESGSYHEKGTMWWRHDVESFKKLWALAGEETGTKWNTWAVLDGGEGMGKGHWAEEGLRQLKFEVQRAE